MRRKRFASTYSFEYFNLLERINHIRILDSMGARPLTGEERNTLIDLVHKTENLDFARIRTALSLPESSTFNMVRYQLASATQAEKGKEGKILLSESVPRNAKNYR